jgi:hypothetical protein
MLLFYIKKILSGVMEEYRLQDRDASSPRCSRRFEETCRLPLRRFLDPDPSFETSGTIYPVTQRRLPSLHSTYFVAKILSVLCISVCPRPHN